MSEATHIVLSESHSFPTNYTRKNRQYLVHVQVGIPDLHITSDIQNNSFQWFWECLCLMGKADESMYAVTFTNNQTTTTTPDSSLLLLSPSTHGDSPLLDSSLNTTVKRKRRHKHSYLPDQIDHTPSSKRFNNSTNENESENDSITDKVVNMKKDNKYLIGMELRETERNYVTMLSNIVRVSFFYLVIGNFSPMWIQLDLQNGNGKG